MKKLLLALLLLIPSSIAWGDQWSGNWEFEECWLHLSGEFSDCVFYSLDIHPAGKQYIIDINMDGYMTMERIRADGKLYNKNLKVIFREYTGDRFGPKHKPGKVLFELKNIKGSIVTKWGALIPSVDDNKKPGIYFKKKSPEAQQQNRGDRE